MVCELDTVRVILLDGCSAAWSVLTGEEPVLQGTIVEYRNNRIELYDVVTTDRIRRTGSCPFLYFVHGVLVVTTTAAARLLA